MKILPLLIISLLPLQAIGGADDNYIDDEDSEEEFSDFYGDDDFVSIATGTKQLLHKAPSVATVITAKKIEEMGAVDLDEVLSSVPGLHISYSPKTQLPVNTLRGIGFTTFNPQVLYLINGIPITNAYAGNRNQIWGGMPVRAISRIEVIRGPGSAVYGADAFAGVVNIITKNASELKGSEIGVRGGSFSTKDLWLSHGTQGEQWDASFVFEHHSTDGYKELIEEDRQTWLDGIFGTSASLAPGTTNQFRDNYDLRVDLGYDNWRMRAGLQQRKVGLGVGLAEALDATGRQFSKRTNFDLNYNSGPDVENWHVEGTLSFFDTTQEVDSDLFVFPVGADIGFGKPFPDGVIGNPEVWERHYRAKLIGRYEKIANHNISVGVGYSLSDQYKVKESKNFAIGPTGQVIEPGSPVVDVTGTDFVFMKEVDRNNKYIFIQDVFNIANDWEITAGIRRDQYSDFGSTINPRFAIVWTTSLDLTSKLLYGKAFRAPANVELHAQNNPVALGNPDVKPENMENLELAFDYHPKADSRFGASIFSYEWDDIIEFVFDINPDGTTSSNKRAQNKGRQKGHGLELEFEYAVTESLALLGNYAWQKSKNQITGEQVANVPKQLLYFAVDYKVNEDINIHLKSSWVMDRLRTSEDLRSAIDDYNLVDFTFNWQPEDRDFSVKIMARNIFDEDVRYSTTNSGTNVYVPNDLPGAGRNVLAELSYKF